MTIFLYYSILYDGFGILQKMEDYEIEIQQRKPADVQIVGAMPMGAGFDDMSSGIKGMFEKMFPPTTSLSSA